MFYNICKSNIFEYKCRKDLCTRNKFVCDEFIRSSSMFSFLTGITNFPNKLAKLRGIFSKNPPDKIFFIL